MQNVKKLFEVTRYENESLFIVATIKRGLREKDLFITKEEFNDWMLRTGRLDKEDDYCDERRCLQVANVMSIEEYWHQSHSEQVKFDLYEFIGNQLLIAEIGSHSSAVFKIAKPVKRMNNMQIA